MPVSAETKAALSGVYDYYHLLEVLANPTHPEYEELFDWCGQDYQPETFDAGEVNRAFHGAWSPVDP